jgi:hypothetical protein
MPNDKNHHHTDRVGAHRARWLTQVAADPQLAAVPLTDEGRDA